MLESKRQKQVGRLIQEEMSSIFVKEGLSMSNGGMVSISKVSVTPDLLEAHIFLSLFQVPNPQQYLEQIQQKTSELRKILGNQLAHNLRRIPELQFFIDDTLDHVFKLEEIFKDINKKEN